MTLADPLDAIKCSNVPESLCVTPLQPYSSSSYSLFAKANYNIAGHGVAEDWLKSTNVATTGTASSSSHCPLFGPGTGAAQGLLHIVGVQNSAKFDLAMPFCT